MAHSKTCACSLERPIELPVGTMDGSIRAKVGRKVDGAYGYFHFAPRRL
jgi:hypothetical protein